MPEKDALSALACGRMQSLLTLLLSGPHLWEHLWQRWVGGVLEGLGTEQWHQSPAASTANLWRWANNLPYDPARIQLFEILFKALKKEEFKNREEQNTTTRAYRNFAFYESYFSNYIEGTVFEIDTAKRIIATHNVVQWIVGRYFSHLPMNSCW